MCRQNADARCTEPTIASANRGAAQARAGASLNLHRSLSVFLFDWDDTLFPTTALTSLGPERLSDALNKVDSVVAELLKAALAVPNSRVIILTNARVGWVWQAAEQFMPKVNALLQAHDDFGPMVLVISAHQARAQFTDAHAYEEAMRVSKSHAVRPLSKALQHMIEDTQAESFQIMSVGDQPHDLAAGHALRELTCCGLEESFVKTIAMKPMPSGVELEKQLQALHRALPKLVSASRSFHQSMCPAQAPSTAHSQCRAAVEATSTPSAAKVEVASTPPAGKVTFPDHDKFVQVASAQATALSTKPLLPTLLAWRETGILRDRSNTWHHSSGEEVKEAPNAEGKSRRRMSLSGLEGYLH